MFAADMERFNPEDFNGNGQLFRLHESRYKFAADYVNGKTVVDIACGTGYGSEILKHAGAKEVYGIDVSHEAVATAQQRHAHEGIMFSVGSAETLSLDKSIDVIVSFETIEHLVSPGLFLSSARRILSPDGTLVISTPARQKGTLESKPENPFHVREWNSSEFVDLLTSHFNNVKVFGQYDFPQSWVPFSRTIRKRILGLISTEALADLELYPVREHNPNFPGFDCPLAYVIAVCTP